MIQIKIERIGDNNQEYFSLWDKVLSDLIPGLGNAVIGKPPALAFCAEITGLHPKFKFERKFLKPNRDYSQANRIGSRGVFDYYNLEEGKIYDIKAPRTWKHTDRYYCRVMKESIVRMDESEVIECLKNRSE